MYTTVNCDLCRKCTFVGGWRGNIRPHALFPFTQTHTPTVLGVAEPLPAASSEVRLEGIGVCVWVCVTWMDVTTSNGGNTLLFLCWDCYFFFNFPQRTDAKSSFYAIGGRKHLNVIKSECFSHAVCVCVSVSAGNNMLECQVRCRVCYTPLKGNRMWAMAVICEAKAHTPSLLFHDGVGGGDSNTLIKLIEIFSPVRLYSMPERILCCPAGGENMRPTGCSSRDAHFLVQCVLRPHPLCSHCVTGMCVTPASFALCIPDIRPATTVLHPLSQAN